MEPCLNCENAEIKKFKNTRYVFNCKAAYKRAAFTLSGNCPLKKLKMSYEPGGSRKEKYLNDHPDTPLTMSGGDFYPAEYEDGQPSMLCTEKEGYIKECDAKPDEDCRDCWDKKYDENA